MNEILVGERLAHIRGSLSQADFAQHLGVHKNTWGNYERGNREIGADALRKLAAKGWSPLWVLTGNGPQRLDDSEVHAEADGIALAARESRAGIATKCASESSSQPYPESLSADPAGATSRGVADEGSFWASLSKAPLSREPALRRVTETQAQSELALISVAVRITEDVLHELGVRGQVNADQYADLVIFVFQRLAHRESDQAAASALKRILSITVPRQP